MTTETYERAALLISRAKSRVNVPDQHHAGMRIIGFKIDPDEWNGNLCLSYPLDCLANVAEAVNNIERLTSENEATLRVLEKATHELEAFHRCVIDDSTRAEIGALIVECWDHLAALSKKGEGE